MSNKSGFAGPVVFAAIALLVLLPLFYVLSTGPVIGLMSRGYISEDVPMAVYSPIDFFCQRFSPVNDGMSWYVGLFRPADDFEVQTDVIYVVPTTAPPAGATTRQPPPAASSGK